MSSTREQLFDLVRSIPRGRVTSYGRLARTLVPRVPAVLVGKWMANSPDDVPWWRVVGANGDIPLAKRDPAMADVQLKKLRQEGVPTDGESVDLASCLHEF